MSPQDFWCFTEFGIRHLLADAFDDVSITPIDAAPGMEFPASYWARATKWAANDS